MNHTNLNTELLAGESRTRKHVPVAVFAVIFIHIVLFLLLLIAAGCRARAKAQQEPAGGPQVAQQAEVPPAVESQAEPLEHEGEVVATEPVIEEEAPVVARAAVHRAPAAENPAAVSDAKYYIVQPGDSLWLIARKHGTTVKALKAMNNLKNDNLQLGQKLRVDFSTPLRAQKT